jgi:hypothetical protein
MCIGGVEPCISINIWGSLSQILGTGSGLRATARGNILTRRSIGMARVERSPASEGNPCAVIVHRLIES